MGQLIDKPTLRKELSTLPSEMERLQENNSKRRKENMEERLTKRAKDSDMVWFNDTENGNMCLEPCEMNAHHSRIAIKELAKYEDAEEQGLLLRLPCKVGTDVYYILGIPNETPCTIDSCVFELSDVHKIGESLFLTREEAEAKLKEMEEE